MSDAALNDVGVEVRHHVALVEIRRPPNNHLDLPLLSAVAQTLEDLDSNDEIRAVVLASAGKNFCGGADLARRDGVAAGDGEGINPFYQAALRVFSTRKPLVAAVQGSAVGAGLGLALACDFRIAAETARFCANFATLGFHPGFGLSYTLPRLIGEHRAQLMFLTGRRVRAAEALAWGLADELSPEENVRFAALGLAQEIAVNAPLAVESVRATGRAGVAAAVKRATDFEFKEQTRLMRTADFAEGVRAVAERRPGAFQRR